MNTLEKMKRGSSRYVFFIFGLAFKIPSLYSYKNFLWGLLANMQEVEFSKCIDFKEKLCPIKFYLPFGLLVIMPIVRVLKENELSVDELELFCHVSGFRIPAEIKYDSFGYLNGKLVVIDFG